MNISGLHAANDHMLDDQMQKNHRHLCTILSLSLHIQLKTSEDLPRDYARQPVLLF